MGMGSGPASSSRRGSLGVASMADDITSVRERGVMTNVDNGSSDGIRLEIASEVSGGLLRWCLFRGATPSFAFSEETKSRNRCQEFAFDVDPGISH